MDVVGTDKVVVDDKSCRGERERGRHRWVLEGSCRGQAGVRLRLARVGVTGAV